MARFEHANTSRRASAASSPILRPGDNFFILLLLNLDFSFYILRTPLLLLLRDLSFVGFLCAQTDTDTQEVLC